MVLGGPGPVVVVGGLVVRVGGGTWVVEVVGGAVVSVEGSKVVSVVGMVVVVVLLVVVVLEVGATAYWLWKNGFHTTVTEGSWKSSSG